MENNSVSENSAFNNNIVYNSTLNIEDLSYREADFNKANYSLTAEVGINLFRYLKNFNLNKDPDLLILPPNNHYYFDKRELRRVRTLINLKNLNLVKDLDNFLFTLNRILRANVNFVGYFSYNKITFSGDSLLTGLSTRLNNLLDAKTDHNMNEKELSRYLGKYGFKVIDMHEMNGLTYFYSKTLCGPVDMPINQLPLSGLAPGILKLFRLSHD